MIVLDKPAGLAVQGGSGISSHVDALLDGLRFGSKERPKLVHRLDKDTSGVLLIGRTAKAAASLTAAFRGHETRKLYWALVEGVARPREGTINLPLEKLPGPQGDRVNVVEPGQERGDPLPDGRRRPAGGELAGPRTRHRADPSVAGSLCRHRAPCRR